MLASAPRRCIPFIDVCVERSPLYTTSRNKFAQKTAGAGLAGVEINNETKTGGPDIDSEWWRGGKGRCRGSQLLVTKSLLFNFFRLLIGGLLFI
jgi:hypothetical protein